MNPFLQEVVAEAVRRQPWYQRNANTIVAGIGAVASVLSFVLTLSLGLPETVVAGIGAAIPVLTAFAVKLTRNGVQMSTAAKLESTPLARASMPDDGLPVYDGPTSAPAYVGKHRLEG